MVMKPFVPAMHINLALRMLCTACLVVLLIRGWVLLSSGKPPNLFSPITAADTKAGTSVQQASLSTKEERAATKRSETARTDALTGAFLTWRTGPLPASIVNQTAYCTPRDVADAILHLPNLSRKTVIDVGANGGYPVTSLALARPVARVVSIEPDTRNFARLRRLYARSPDARFFAVLGAASERKGRSEMRFHRTRNDFSCFACLDVRKGEVYTRVVDVVTVDGLILDGDMGRATVHRDSPLEQAGDETAAMRPVALLKSDSQGHEREVLSGARRLLGLGVVENVIVEFDPKLLHTRENAVAALRLALDAGGGMACAHLRFAGLSEREAAAAARREGGRLMFGRAITAENVEAFYEFVVKGGGYTDVFCSKRREAVAAS